MYKPDSQAIHLRSVLTADLYWAKKHCFVCKQMGRFARSCPVNKQDDNTKEEKQVDILISKKPGAANIIP